MSDKTQTLPRPPIIKYNLKDRGRNYLGKERNFNIPAIVAAINSPRTQERVKTRGMLGYYGHKVRQLGGLDPSEAIVLNGKYNEVEPAIITTYLKAFPDGTIEHQTEFIDNEPGRKAAKMWESKVGGFSSAIDESIPEFYGFDWVLSPNYSGNRGYTLDSTSNITFDSILAEVKAEQEELFLRLIESKENQINALSIALDSVTAENEELMSLLSKKQLKSAEILSLDSTGQSPVTLSMEKTNRLKRDRDFFMSSSLPGLDDKTTSAKTDFEHKSFLNLFGM